MLAGHRIGRFELVQSLGHGASGQVWEALEQPTSRRVALKLLGEGGPPPERELERAATLDHLNVVGVIEHGAVLPTESAPPLPTGMPWIAFELVTGPSLAQVIRQGGVTCWADASAVLLALLDALAHAHARGVVHLDLKPGNVLLGPRGFTDARLTDFGVALAWDRRDEGTIYGTPPYMAPEQFSGQRAALGPWTDLYAVGCMTYALCMGRSPVATGPVRDQAFAHRSGDYLPFAPHFPVPEDLPGWLSALMVSSTNRPRSARRVAHALGRLGPPSWTAGARQTPSGRATETLTLSSLDTLEPLPDDTEAPVPVVPCRFERPGVPVHWPQARRPAPRTVDAASGASLARLRSLPLLGREPVQHALWQAVRALGKGTSQRVWLHGPERVGRRSVLRWLAQSTAEVDAATVLTVDPTRSDAVAAAVRSLLKLDDLRDLEVRAAAMGRSSVWIATTRRQLVGTSTALRDWLAMTLSEGPHIVLLPDTEAALELTEQETTTLWVVRSTRPAPHGYLDVAVPPLCPSRLNVLIRHLVPLDPRTEHELVRSAEGRPGLLVDLILEQLPAMTEHPEGLSLAKMPAAPATEPAPDALPLAAFQVPVPTAIAERLLGASLKGLLDRGVLWRADGHVSFVRAGTAAATRAEVGPALHQRAADACFSEAAAPAKTTGYDPFLLHTEQLVLAGEPAQAAALGWSALNDLCGSRSLREWVVLAWRTFEARPDPHTEAALTIERAALDRMEGRLELAEQRLDAITPPLDLRLRWSIERGRIAAMNSDLEGALVWMECDAPSPTAGTTAYHQQLLANARAWLGRTDEAIPTMIRAHAAHVGASRWVPAGYAALRLGSWAPDAGWLERARAHFERADHALGIAETRSQLGHRARAEGRLHEAAQHYQTFLRVARAHGRGDAMFAELNLGLVHLGQGMPDAAAERFLEALGEALAQGNKEAAIAARVGLAAARARAEGPCEAALSDALRALQLAPSRHPDILWLLDRAAEGLRWRGRTDLAERVERARASLG